MSKQQVKIGLLELDFFIDGEDTAGNMISFEVKVPAGGKVPAAHHHSAVDEVVLVLEGTLTFTLNGEKSELRPSEKIYVPRGAVHHFANEKEETARFLTVQTPASIKPEYYKEIAAAFSAGGPPDMAKIGAIMASYGVVPIKG